MGALVQIGVMMPNLRDEREAGPPGSVAGAGGGSSWRVSRDGNVAMRVMVRVGGPRVDEAGVVDNSDEVPPVSPSESALSLARFRPQNESADP